MSKSPDQVISANAITTLVSVINKISDVLADSEQFVKIILDSVLYKLRRHMADLLVMASRNARLSGVDELIYDTYKCLIDYYCMSLKRYEECERMIANPMVKTIIDGIYSVLKSEMRSKDENIAADGENPIIIEKKAIVSKSISFFSKAIESGSDVFIARGLEAVRKKTMETIIQCTDADGISLTEKAISEIVTFAVSIINSECFGDFEMYFTDSMKYSVTNLNDLESRKTTNFYYELLEKEFEILSSIVKIQVVAIDNEKTSSVGEKIAINSFITYLLEAYQFLSKNINEIKACFNNSDDNLMFNIRLELEYDRLEGLLSEIIKNRKFQACESSLKHSISELTSNIKQWVKHEIECEMFGRHTRKKAYEYSLRITQVMDMADEMIKAFKKITLFYENNHDNYQTGTSLDIIKGINETIAIKIECLNENKEHFKEMAADVIAGLKNCNLSVADDELDINMTHVIQNLLSTQPELDKDGKIDKKYHTFVKTVLYDSFGNIIQKYKNSFEKKTAAYDTQFEKRDFTFKRDYLLYEVTTFEEILQYSVSRLANDKDAAVSAFTETFYNSAKLIDTVLKKNSIFQIKPEPHEMFNSKEHEVLMVEKNPDFEKGEIIKLMNSGYRQYEQVIVRANVIAAK